MFIQKIKTLVKLSEFDYEDLYERIQSKFIELKWRSQKAISIGKTTLLWTLTNVSLVFLFSLIVSCSAENEEFSNCFFDSINMYLGKDSALLERNCLIFYIENASSLVINGIFIGFLLKDIMKAQPALWISPALYVIYYRQTGELFLRFRIADLFNSFAHCAYRLHFSYFDSELRFKEYHTTRTRSIEYFEFCYHEDILLGKIECDGKILCNFEKTIIEALRKIFDKDNVMKHAPHVCLTITAWSVKTGEEIVFIKKFSRNQIIFVKENGKVFYWKKEAPFMTPRKWILFEEYETMAKKDKKMIMNLLFGGAKNNLSENSNQIS